MEFDKLKQLSPGRSIGTSQAEHKCYEGTLGFFITVDGPTTHLIVTNEHVAPSGKQMCYNYRVNEDDDDGVDQNIGTPVTKALDDGLVDVGLIDITANVAANLFTKTCQCKDTLTTVKEPPLFAKFLDKSKEADVEAVHELMATNLFQVTMYGSREKMADYQDEHELDAHRSYGVIYLYTSKKQFNIHVANDKYQPGALEKDKEDKYVTKDPHFNWAEKGDSGSAVTTAAGELVALFYGATDYQFYNGYASPAASIVRWISVQFPDRAFKIC